MGKGGLPRCTTTGEGVDLADRDSLSAQYERFMVETVKLRPHLAVLVRRKRRRAKLI